MQQSGCDFKGTGLSSKNTLVFLFLREQHTHLEGQHIMVEVTISSHYALHSSKDELLYAYFDSIT